MNVFYLPDYSVHNTVAFVPAMSVGSGKVAQIPFLIDLPAGQTAQSPVASGSIVGFDFGVTVSTVDGNDVKKVGRISTGYPDFQRLLLATLIFNI